MLLRPFVLPHSLLSAGSRWSRGIWPLSHDPISFTVSSSHLCLSLILVMFKKIKFFDGTTWAERCLEDHIIQSAQCLDVSHSLSSLLTWPLNIYFWNGFTNCYGWLKDSWKMCIQPNMCWMVVGFNKTKQQKKQTTCLVLHAVTVLYKTKCCVNLYILWPVSEQPIQIQDDNNLGSNSELFLSTFLP